MAVITTTEATPIITPREVRRLRILFRRIERKQFCRR
jgi:hypothetical protein